MYTFDSRIRYSETDADERLTLTALTDYFQDCSTFQSEDLGVGVKYLQKQHLVWVLSSWQIVIDEYPKLGDHVTVGTFPYQFKTFMGSRNFFMDRKDGQRLAYANSLWTLLDTETMQPARVTEEMTTRYIPEEKLPMEYAPRKIALPSNLEKQPVITVQPFHLDSNHHVNNAQYVKMAFACLQEDTTVRQMRAEYKMQAHLGDVIVPYSATNENVTTVSLCNESGDPYAIVEFTAKED